MSDPRQNAHTAQQFLSQVWTLGNVGRLETLIGPQHVHHFTAFDVQGPAGVRELVQQVRAAFPDVAFHVEDVISGDDRVVLRARATATHADTGQSVQYQIIDIFRFEGGQIVERWGEYNTAHLTQQIQPPR